MMQFSWMLVLLPLLVSCDSSEPAAGWEYRPSEGGYPKLIYRWEDADQTVLIGTCRTEPSYMLRGGKYRSNATQFTVTADDQSWILHITKHAHGRYLLIEQPDHVRAIGQAKRRVVFEVGNWRRELRPATPLATFDHACG